MGKFIVKMNILVDIESLEEAFAHKLYRNCLIISISMFKVFTRPTNEALQLIYYVNDACVFFMTRVLFSHSRIQI